MSRLQFLKLGGSLITEKNRPRKHRPQVMARLADEIQAVFTSQPHTQMLLGHGSGSFGHFPAKKYSTRQGVQTPAQWRGFVEVWRQAADLNHLVMQALHAAELPAIAFPPSAAITAKDGRVASWNLFPIEECLSSGTIPVVFGDVVFDSLRGGTILSTEDLFSHLALHLKPSQVLLAGIEPGVWVDYPQCRILVHEITPNNFRDIFPSLSGSASTDVTGGMLSKVESSLSLVSQIPGLQVQIFSGAQPGNLQRALGGEHVGTLIHASTL